jgi:hypothetical protein
MKPNFVCEIALDVNKQHTITEFFDIIHRPVLFKTRNISETGFCLRLQKSQLDSIDGLS